MPARSEHHRGRHARRASRRRWLARIAAAAVVAPLLAGREATVAAAVAWIAGTLLLIGIGGLLALAAFAADHRPW